MPLPRAPERPAANDPFDKAAAVPVPGRVEQLAPGLRRLLAPNPSPMTLHGTNCYIVGTGAVALIDPGPNLPGHRQALRDALDPGERITAILVTHAHSDHSEAAAPLAVETGAPVLAFGDADAGRSPRMAALVALGMPSRGSEGRDAEFRPTRRLADGDVVEGQDWRLTAHWTPGHFGNHLCFAWQDRIFCGDLVMGWSSSIVAPPDGDMDQYMASLDRVAGLGARVLHPGHGPDIADPRARIAALRAHRLSREAQILAALRDGPLHPRDLAEMLYRDTPPVLLAAAERNVHAHLLALLDRGRVAAEGKPLRNARFRLERPDFPPEGSGRAPEPLL